VDGKSGTLPLVQYVAAGGLSLPVAMYHYLHH